jgi:hypothetical protein
MVKNRKEYSELAKLYDIRPVPKTTKVQAPASRLRGAVWLTGGLLC